jgi:RalA-binding protein 1
VNAPSLTPEDIRSPRQQIFQNLPTPSYDQQSFTQTQSFPQLQHFPQQLRSGNDTGFTPLHPSYEPQYQPFPTMVGPEYNNRAVSTIGGPAYDQFNGGNDAYRKYATDTSSGVKSKRRESSMFGLGMAPRKGSNKQLRDDRELPLVEHWRGC